MGKWGFHEYTNHASLLAFGTGLQEGSGQFWRCGLEDWKWNLTEDSGGTSEEQNARRNKAGRDQPHKASRWTKMVLGIGLEAIHVTVWWSVFWLCSKKQSDSELKNSGLTTQDSTALNLWHSYCWLLSTSFMVKFGGREQSKNIWKPHSLDREMVCLKSCLLKELAPLKSSQALGTSH